MQFQGVHIFESSGIFLARLDTVVYWWRIDINLEGERPPVLLQFSVSVGGLLISINGSKAGADALPSVCATALSV